MAERTGIEPVYPIRQTGVITVIRTLHENCPEGRNRTG